MSQFTQKGELIVQLTPTDAELLRAAAAQSGEPQRDQLGIKETRGLALRALSLVCREFTREGVRLERPTQEAM